jgi:hypothetical protein
VSPLPVEYQPPAHGTQPYPALWWVPATQYSQSSKLALACVPGGQSAMLRVLTE